MLRLDIGSHKAVISVTVHATRMSKAERVSVAIPPPRGRPFNRVIPTDCCQIRGCVTHTTRDTGLCRTHELKIARHLGDGLTRPQMADLEVEVRNLRIQLLDYEVSTARPKRDGVGFVYAIRVGGFVKIGWTSDLEKRMRQYPPDSALLAVMPGQRVDEKRVHDRLATHRAHGREWFALTPPVMEWIRAITAKHGAPAQPDWSARPVAVPMPYRERPFSSAKHRNQRKAV